MVAQKNIVKPNIDWGKPYGYPKSLHIGNLKIHQSHTICGRDEYPAVTGLTVPLDMINFHCLAFLKLSERKLYVLVGP